MIVSARVHHTADAGCDKPTHVLRLYRRATIGVLLVVASGCARAVRSDAKKIADLGSTTAGQMSALYEAAQKDATDTFELNQFYLVYANPSPSFSLSDRDKTQLEILQETNRVLASRVRLANAMKDLYSTYAKMSDYDNAAEMETSVGKFVGALNAASVLAFPQAAPAGQAISNTASGLLKALANEVGKAQQNKTLITEGNRAIPLLQRLSAILEVERKLLTYEAAFQDVDGSTGLPRTDANGKPVMVNVPGIAGLRVNAYKRLYQTLVSSNAVVSQGLLNRFMSGSGLQWPDTNKPFTDSGLKAGINRLIELDAYRRGQAADNAGEQVVKSLDKLVTLHRQLASKQSLSLQEALDQSALTQFWLDQLSAKGFPTDVLSDLIKAVTKHDGGSQ